MGVFSRFKDIVNSNINALLDKAEDPEKMLKLMMQEMEDTLIELKAGCAAKMAQRIRLEKKISDQMALVNRWQSRAELAVDKGRDDLAKDALLEKKKELENLLSLKEDLKSYESMISESKAEISQLEDKLNQAKQKLKLLQEKAKQARREAEVNDHLKKASDFRFDSFEDKINEMYATNELNKAEKSAEEKFRDLEEQEEIEKELEELKRGRK